MVVGIQVHLPLSTINTFKLIKDLCCLVSSVGKLIQCNDVTIYCSPRISSRDLKEEPWMPGLCPVTKEQTCVLIMLVSFWMYDTNGNMMLHKVQISHLFEFIVKEMHIFPFICKKFEFFKNNFWIHDHEKKREYSLVIVIIPLINNWSLLPCLQVRHIVYLLHLLIPPWCPVVSSFLSF